MMQETLEKLWDEYFFEKCAVIDTEEERALMKKAEDMYKTASESLTPEQSEAVEQYVEAVCKTQDLFAKKAFMKGCELATSLLFEVGAKKR